MYVLFSSATLHGQLLVHLYALLSCHAASVKCFYKSRFLWQINDDDDDDLWFEKLRFFCEFFSTENKIRKIR